MFASEGFFQPPTCALAPWTKRLPSDLRERALQEKAVVLTARRIANRAGPRVFIRPGVEHAGMPLADPVPPMRPRWVGSDLQRFKIAPLDDLVAAAAASKARLEGCGFLPARQFAL